MQLGDSTALSYRPLLVDRSEPSSSSRPDLPLLTVRETRPLLWSAETPAAAASSASCSPGAASGSRLSALPPKTVREGWVGDAGSAGISTGKHVVGWTPPGTGTSNCRPSGAVTCGAAGSGCLLVAAQMSGSRNTGYVLGIVTGGGDGSDGARTSSSSPGPTPSGQVT